MTMTEQLKQVATNLSSWVVGVGATVMIAAGTFTGINYHELSKTVQHQSTQQALVEAQIHRLNQDMGRIERELHALRTVLATTNDLLTRLEEREKSRK